jgi:hypothetical protein
MRRPRRARGGIGRRAGLRIPWSDPCRFKSCRAHQQRVESTRACDRCQSLSSHGTLCFPAEIAPENQCLATSRSTPSRAMIPHFGGTLLPRWPWRARSPCRRIGSGGLRTRQGLPKEAYSVRDAATVRECPTRHAGRAACEADLDDTLIVHGETEGAFKALLQFCAGNWPSRWTNEVAQ